jgi:hypothetical protein
MIELILSLLAWPRTAVDLAPPKCQRLKRSGSASFSTIYSNSTFASGTLRAQQVIPNFPYQAYQPSQGQELVTGADRKILRAGAKALRIFATIGDVKPLFSTSRGPCNVTLVAVLEDKHSCQSLCMSWCSPAIPPGVVEAAVRTAYSPSTGWERYKFLIVMLGWLRNADRSHNHTQRGRHPST